MVFWHPRGWQMVRQVEACSRELYARHGFEEVRSPQLLDRSLWEKSGHWDKYRANMFVIQGEGEGAAGSRVHALKPMSCPGHIAIFDKGRHSYRDLPRRLFEFGNVHRNEPSGSLNGLLRLRSFVQDDAHLFVKMEDIEGEVARFARMVREGYAAFGLAIDHWQISLRPDNRAGSNEDWDQAEGALREACRNMGIEAAEVPGEGAFYGPKLEVSLRDRLGRSWQCGVMQVDFVLPKRFELVYMGADNKPHVPVLLHQAVFGSLERWMGIVLEHYGHDLPLWLAPQAFEILPIDDSAEVMEACQNLWQQLRKKDAGVVLQRSESPLRQRMKDAFEQHIPWCVVIGRKDIDKGVVSLRHRSGQSVVLPVADFLDRVDQVMAERLGDLPV
jgi:threonyl-tRNA synthetase